MKIPIPYPHVKDMPDEQLVPKIKNMVPQETAEFFYGKAAPVFIKLFNGYYTDCNETIEFIDDFYLDLMVLRPVAKSRKIDGFAFECMFKNWIGKLALMYCYGKYEMKEQERKFLESLTIEDIDPGLKENVSNLDKRDVDALLKAMTCENYRDLIRMLYVDELTMQEASEVMGVTLDNLYNIHRRAKLQYMQVYNKEMRL